MRQTLETLLRRSREGDKEALGKVVTLLYSDLRRLAAYHFRGEAPGHTLQPTILVHEVWARLAAGKPVEWQNRAQFFAVASQQMRWILVDYARQRKALKRGDTRIVVSLSHETARPGPQLEDLLAVNEALEALETPFPRVARVVELRVFGGLSEAEIASALEIGLATVKRDWTRGRAWLQSRLAP